MAGMKLGGAAFAVALAALALAAVDATATVTAISTGGSDGTRYPLVSGDAADDTIAVTCGTDLNVKINGLDPVARADPAIAVPIACGVMTGIGVDGGPGTDVLDLTGLTRAAGFTDPRLCAPCPNGGYSVSAECESAAGDDTILAGSIGALIGYCANSDPMAGADVVVGASGQEAVALGPDADDFAGLGGRDLVVGGGASDVIRGDSGDDRLEGGPGDDTLRGGSGFDRCFGGPGDDTATGCEKRSGI